MKLSESGVVLISARALDEYLEATRGSADAPEREEARRELTEILLDAHPTGPTDSGKERWRYRTRSFPPVDISCAVARWGRLAIVTSLGKVRVHPAAPEMIKASAVARWADAAQVRRS